MNYIKSYRIFEKRIPKTDKIEVYRDSNIVVIQPLTHESHKKYAQHCQWCINSDFYEWDEYHKGGYVLIIQRKPIVVNNGISGKETASEIYAMEHGIFEEDYQFDNRDMETDYFNKITSNINNFDLNVVYYGNGVMYDRENNNIFEYNRDGGASSFKLGDIPNVTKEAVDKIHEHLGE